MTNYEWLLQMGGEERQAWFDAEHVDANDTLSAENDVRADDVCANDVDVSQDSREKLEADIEEYLACEYGCIPGIVAVYPDWLDRQDAITERETKLRELYKFDENHRYHIRSIEEVNQKLNKRIAELTAERDALADDLLTCNKESEHYRELFSEALTLAAEIVNLQP